MAGHLTSSETTEYRDSYETDKSISSDCVLLTWFEEAILLVVFRVTIPLHSTCELYRAALSQDSELLAVFRASLSSLTYKS